MTQKNGCELVDLLPELEEREIIAQVTRFARPSIDLHSKRQSCEIRVNVGGGKIGRFKKLETVRLPGDMGRIP